MLDRNTVLSYPELPRSTNSVLHLPYYTLEEYALRIYDTHYVIQHINDESLYWTDGIWTKTEEPHLFNGHDLATMNIPHYANFVELKETR